MLKPASAVRILAIIVLLVGSVLPLGASRAVSDNPDWTFHASFDQHPRKIFDTPDKVYFFVHQIIYDPTYSGNAMKNWYNKPSGAILVLDKNNKAAGLQNLRSMTNLSGADMRMVNIDPSSGTILIAYSDGGIDVVTSDLKVTYYDLLKRRTYPGAYTVNNISFDNADHNVWIGTGDGFICISPAKQQVVYNAQWGVPVYDICPVGENVVAVINKTLHAAPAGSDLRMLDSFKSIASASSGIGGDILRLMPVDATNFVFATSSGIFARAYLQADGSWKNARLVQDTGTLQGAAVSVCDRLEQTWMPTAKGLFFASASKGYFVNRSETEGGAPVLKTISLPSGSTIYSASYDQENFWFYQSRSKFIELTLTGSTWSEPSVYTNNGPLVCMDVEFRYSPEYGFICINSDPGFKISSPSGYHGCLMPPLITSYRSGKWTNLSAAHNRPYYADENASFANTWNSNPKFTPLGDPQGVALDPIYPNWIHMGSLWCGVAALRLDDPREKPVINCTPNFAFANYSEIAIKDFPQQTWGTITCASVAGFDADGVLWVSHNNHWRNGHNGDVSMRYWTPEARRSALETGNLSQTGKWVEICIPAEYYAETWNVAKALAHPRNKGIILANGSGGYSAKEGGRPLVIFNHHGTLEDTSDDTLDFVTRVILDNGSKMPFGMIYRIDENPYTGDVYVFTMYETFIIDVTKPVVDNTIHARNLTFKSDFGPGCEFLNPTEIFTSCFDEYGRIWLGGRKTGVIGLNADSSELIANYTTDNSPLPSNNIHGLGWNPETKSLFISTDMGIVETKVEGQLRTSEATGIQAPFLTPELIRADYAGSVTVNNIPPGASLKAVDADGRTVAVLPAPAHGVSYWDLLDLDGKRVPTGCYRIIDSTATTDFPALQVVVTR